MKWVYVCVCCWCAGGAFAQPPIADTVLPAPGVFIVQHSFDQQFFPTVFDGPNPQQWNFTDAVGFIDGYDTLAFVAAAGVPGDTAFAAANTALSTELELYVGQAFQLPLTEFYSSATNGLQLLGYHVPAATMAGPGVNISFPAQTVVLSAPDTLASTPLTTVSAFGGAVITWQVQGTVFDTVPVQARRTYTRLTEAVGWGTLALPATELLDVLVLQHVVNSHDTVFWDVGNGFEQVSLVNPVQSFDTLYQFWNPTYGLVAEVKRLLTVSGIDETYIQTGWYRANDLPVALGEAEPALGIQVWPNPSGGVVSVRSNRPIRLELVNALGTRVCAFEHPGDAATPLQLPSTLANGVYRMLATDTQTGARTVQPIVLARE